jgi:hypothetical protein
MTIAQYKRVLLQSIITSQTYAQIAWVNGTKPMAKVRNYLDLDGLRRS